VDWRLIILGILRRVFVAIAFLITMIYASAALFGAVTAIVESIMYTKCLFSTGFHFQHADIMFNILTKNFSRDPQTFFKAAALFVGLPIGIWGAWHALSKGVNPFKYMWERE
jgi:hypothetical protein